MSEPDAKRVLLAILVFNGREFVPNCLKSVARARKCAHHVDVIVLDDCSDEAGWSDELLALTEQLNMSYYRSPRNLGIPRNMNLALLRAMESAYDYIVLLNSDLVLPLNFVPAMLAAAQSDAPIGSVTAWSNNVSVFSLPHGVDGALLSGQHSVDWLSSILEKEFKDKVIEIPSAVGFCMLIPTAVIPKVGLLDPIFGRGYCEEVDWSLRAKSLGFRSVLAPAVFVYHHGQGSTRSAGLLQEKHSTVPAHEAIIDWRFPSFRKDVEDFSGDPSLPKAVRSTHDRIVLESARQYGYCLEATWFSQAKGSDGFVWFTVDPAGRSKSLRGQFMGFETEIALNGSDLVAHMEGVVGRPPQKVRVSDRGIVSDRLLADAGRNKIEAMDRRSYPERI